MHFPSPAGLRHLCSGLLLALGFATFCIADDSAMRTWTDVQGRTLQAELLGKRGGQITIQRSDGKQFTLPVEQLSTADREFVAKWTPPPPKVPPVEQAVLLISTPAGRGSGFLAQEDGQVYAYTNQHMIAGAPIDQIKLSSTAGRSFTASGLEIIPAADLARLQVDANEGLLLGKPAHLDDEIAVYGNSQGMGVTTLSRGKVIGASADQLEISAEIVPGNSGGPVLNKANEVVGVSTYLAWQRNEGEEDDNPMAWTLKGTRYEKTPRRFALRVRAGMDWEAQSPVIYASQSQRVFEFDRLLQTSVVLAKQLMESPKGYVPTGMVSQESLMRVVRQQESFVKFFQTSLSKSYFSERDIVQLNDKLNRYYKRSFYMIEDELKRAIVETKNRTPRLEVPYLVERYEELSKQATAIVEQLAKIRESPIPFVRLAD